MRVRSGPLLAELHAHTTWSDGAFSIEQVVDIHGSRGFDVLCITDHVIRADDPWHDPEEWRDRGVRADVHAAYLAEAVACGDFHRAGHLNGWKTLLPCEKEAATVVDYLRSPRPAYLTRAGAERPLLAA